MGDISIANLDDIAYLSITDIAHPAHGDIALTVSEISTHTRRVAKPVRYPESMLLRLEAGVLARLKTAAGEKEVAEIVRAAVMADLAKRERIAAKVKVD